MDDTFTTSPLSRRLHHPAAAEVDRDVVDRARVRTGWSPRTRGRRACRSSLDTFGRDAYCDAAVARDLDRRPARRRTGSDRCSRSRRRPRRGPAPGRGRAAAATPRVGQARGSPWRRRSRSARRRRCRTPAGCWLPGRRRRRRGGRRRRRDRPRCAGRRPGGSPPTRAASCCCAAASWVWSCACWAAERGGLRAGRDLGRPARRRGRSRLLPCSVVGLGQGGAGDGLGAVACSGAR